MKIKECGSSLELLISSAVTNNYVISNNKKYVYKRIVIPEIIMKFLLEKKPDITYLYLYFLQNQIFLSYEKLPDYKFSRRKIMQIQNKNSFFINLNTNSLSKHNISVGSEVLFIVAAKPLPDSASNISIELKF